MARDMKKTPSMLTHIAAVTLVALVLYILASCGKNNVRSDEIYYAAANGDLDKVKALLKDNPDLVSSKDKDGYTPLHLAAVEGHTDVVKYLLAGKADVNALDKDDETPLHLAAFKGHKDVVELLLTSRADVNAKADDGTTPLHLATQKDHKDMASLLLASNANVNAKADDGTTPFTTAVFLGYKDIAELLRQHGGHE